MKAHPVALKTRRYVARSLVFFFLMVSPLTACSSTPTSSRLPGQVSDPAIPAQGGGQPPIILRVVERAEVIDGYQYTYGDIYFYDPEGDAVAVTYRQISSSLSYLIPLTDDPIEASVEQQKDEALFTAGGRCRSRMELVLEILIRDRAGNLSAPAILHLACTIPPVVEKGSVLVSGLSIALPLALLLLLGFWLLFRKRPTERLPAFRSMILLFCLLLIVQFVGMILHEGGHGLYLVFRGVPTVLYAHPFNFPGYARPMIDTSNWFNILGSLTSLTVSLLIALLFWKRRSPALLPLIMLFPYQAIYDGSNILSWLGGDFANVIQVNALSPLPFILLGLLIILTGLLLLFALLPLLGLDPRNNSSLFVLPAAMFVASFLSFLVAVTLVPGSPIDREYFLGLEIVTVARMILPIQTLAWMLLALLYVTLYRRLCPRLPAWLRAETVQLSWKDLRLPAVLAAISVILGLIIIT